MDQHALISVIEATAPLKAAADWDASGLQVASRKNSVNTLAVCLDPTPASVAQALELGADFILSHHPLALKARLPNVLDNYHQVLRLLLSSEVALYAAHTSLDASPKGPVSWLANEFQLRERRPLEITGTEPLTGFGLSGLLPSPLSTQLFLDKLLTLTREPCTTICGELPEEIERIAYCTGSGASLLAEALAAEAQVYITGDVKYHAALDAGLCVIDVGHHSLEEEMMRRFSRSLAEDLPELCVHFVPSTSPFRPLFRNH